MKISSAFPSEYIKAADLNEKTHRLIMSHVEIKEIGQQKDKKPVLFFRNAQKGLVLNKVNSRTIAAKYGDESEDWRDKAVELYPTTVEFSGEIVEAIRVRVPKGTVESFQSKDAVKAATAADPDEGGHDDDVPF
jgi:hypothetical protein